MKASIPILFAFLCLCHGASCAPSYSDPIQDVYISNLDNLNINLNDHFQGSNLNFDLSTNSTSSSAKFSVSQRLDHLSNYSLGSENIWTVFHISRSVPHQQETIAAALNTQNQLYVFSISFAPESLEPVESKTSEIKIFDLNTDAVCTDVLCVSQEIIYVACLGQYSDSSEEVLVFNVTSGESKAIPALTVSFLFHFSSNIIKIERSISPNFAHLFFLYQPYDAALGPVYGNQYIEIWSCQDPWNPFPLQTTIDSVVLGLSDPLMILGVRAIDDNILFIADVNEQIHQVELDPYLVVPTKVSTYLTNQELTAFEVTKEIFAAETETRVFFGSNDSIIQLDWTDIGAPSIAGVYSGFGSNQEREELVSIRASSRFLYLVLENGLAFSWKVFQVGGSEIYWSQEESGSSTPFFSINQRNDEPFILTKSSIDLYRFDSPVITASGIDSSSLGVYNLSLTVSDDNSSIVASFLLVIGDPDTKKVLAPSNYDQKTHFLGLSGSTVKVPIDTGLIVGNLPKITVENPAKNELFFMRDVQFNSFLNGNQTLQGTIDTLLFKSGLDDDSYFYATYYHSDSTDQFSVSVDKCSFDAQSESLSCHSALQLGTTNFKSFLGLGNSVGILCQNRETGESSVEVTNILSGGNSMFSFSLSSDPFDWVSECSSASIDKQFYIVCSAPFKKQVTVYRLLTTSLEEVLVITKDQLKIDYFVPLGVKISLFYEELLFIRHQNGILVVKMNLDAQRVNLVSEIRSPLIDQDQEFQIAIGKERLVVISSKLNSVQLYSLGDISAPLYLSELPVSILSNSVSTIQSTFLVSENNLFYAQLAGTNDSYAILAIFDLEHSTINSVLASITYSSTFNSTQDFKLLVSCISNEELDVVMVVNNHKKGFTGFLSPFSIYPEPFIIHNTLTLSESFGESYNQTIAMNISSQLSPDSFTEFDLSLELYSTNLQITLNKTASQEIYLNKSMDEMNYTIKSLSVFGPHEPVIEFQLNATHQEDIENQTIKLFNALTMKDTFLNPFGIGEDIISLGFNSDLLCGATSNAIYCNNPFSSEVVSIGSSNCSGPSVDINAAFSCVQGDLSSLVLFYYSPQAGLIQTEEFTTVSEIIESLTADSFVFSFIQEGIQVRLNVYDIEFHEADIDFRLLSTIQVGNGLQIKDIDIAKMSSSESETNGKEYRLLLLLSGDELIDIDVSVAINNSSISNASVTSYSFSNYPGLLPSLSFSFEKIACKQLDGSILSCAVSTENYNHYELQVDPSSKGSELRLIGTYVGFPGYSVVDFQATHDQIAVSLSPRGSSNSIIAVYPRLNKSNETDSTASIYGGIVLEGSSVFSLKEDDDGEGTLCASNSSNADNLMNNVYLYSAQEPKIRFNDISNIKSKEISLSVTNFYSSESLKLALTNRAGATRLSSWFLVLILIACLFILGGIGIALELKFSIKSTKIKITDVNPVEGQTHEIRRDELTSPIVHYDQENNGTI